MRIMEIIPKILVDDEHFNSDNFFNWTDIKLNELRYNWGINYPSPKKNPLNLLQKTFYEISNLVIFLYY